VPNKFLTTRARIFAICAGITLLAWLFGGAVQTNHGVEFDWSVKDGFRHIDACPESSTITRMVEAPYCLLVAIQAEPFISSGFKKRGWTEARGTLFASTIPFTPIVRDVYLGHGSVIDPTTTDLMRAARNGDTAQVKQLIEQGAPVNARNQDGGTALMKACLSNAVSIDLLKALFNAGANVNAADNSGATALHAATADGLRLVCVKELIAQGADVNTQNGTGDTPLILVVMHAQTETDAEQAIRMLISAGARSSIMNHSGETALSWANRLGRGSLAPILSNANTP
jgi:Ankyrin repeats (3 copies)